MRKVPIFHIRAQKLELLNKVIFSAFLVNSLSPRLLSRRQGLSVILCLLAGRPAQEGRHA